MKYSSKTPMLKSRKQKDFKVIKNLLEQNQKVGEYHQAFLDLNVQQIHKILKKYTQGNTKGDFILYFNTGSRLKVFPFVLFLTKRQKKYYKIWENNKVKFELYMSNTHFHKTCFATILLNRDIYYYIKYGVLPPPPKIKRINTPLAIEMKNLIDFDGNPTPPVKKDLIPVSKTKPPISKTKPDLISVSKTQNKIDQIIEKNLTDFSKDPYKNYTQNQSLKKIKNEVLNALVNEINYPLTKDILGLNLTKDLKEKISKLTSEAAVGLAWIIRALVLSNKGKLPVYYKTDDKGKITYFQLSKAQIKEIIGYYFSTLAILLNPAKKL